MHQKLFIQIVFVMAKSECNDPLSIIAPQQLSANFPHSNRSVTIDAACIPQTIQPWSLRTTVAQTINNFSEA